MLLLFCKGNGAVIRCAKSFRVRLEGKRMCKGLSFLEERARYLAITMLDLFANENTSVSHSQAPAASISSWNKSILLFFAKYTMDRKKCCKSHGSALLCLLFFVVLIPGLTLAKISSSEIDQWSVTQIDIVKFNYLWTLKNFSLYTEEEGENLKSPLFSASMQNDRHSWSVLLYPRGYSNSNQLSVFVQYASGDAPTLKADYKISILNSSYEEVATVKGSKLFNRVGEAYGSRTMIRRSYVLNAANGVLPNDELAIYVEVAVYLGKSDMNGDCDFISHRNKSEERFSDHLKQFLMNPKLSDVKLEAIGGQLYPAHSIVLASRSSVFEQLIFANDVANKVIQTNITPDLMPEFLRFLYTGRVEKFDENAEALLSISHAYGLSDLKQLTEKRICHTINLGNSISIALLAEKYGADDLKRKALNFISAHVAEYLSSADFQNLEKNHPELLIELLSAIVNK
ncbi:hypothetical protein TSAR_012836 [Trichomalopsis sarcophagae]|uniref:BTB domain-containing protein n=1 Tax=Trichomalopsis sarcophagae TaxID=543379 RepID=A0A232EWW7_9HYME|nr:hypothetical protein TSAR_012836 [Trichomalopsis sarcophagae]